MYYFYHDEIMDISVLQIHAYTCVTLVTTYKKNYYDRKMHLIVRSQKLYFTKSSKISRWCTWMVISVSNFTLSNLERSCVVWLINIFRISRNLLLVACMIFLSSLAFCRASSESCVHNIWIPSNPTYKFNM